ncbi:MAG: GntR family transcriptional regulator [Eubacteriales bacterium]|nr:GntR family transcriptional regulator [Eubacteriales bacterium]
MELDNTIATPLYQQLESKLQQEIESGQRPVGSRIPTENELSQQYNVSRVTVRKALAGLSEQGYLERKSGKGTFVAEKKFQRGISGVTSFSDLCKMTGFTPGAKTIKIALEDPTEKEAELMHLAPEEKIILLERIRYADGKPVLLETNRFPEFFSFLFSENLNDASLFELLRTKHNILLSHSTKTIDITFASSKEAKILGIAKGYPLLRINSVIQNTDDTITNLCQQLCIGDKFKIMV